MSWYNTFIIRHAEVGDGDDPSLNAIGIEQAMLIGKAIASYRDRRVILSSPYKRALETANLIAEHVNVSAFGTIDIFREYEPQHETWDDMIERGKFGLYLVNSLTAYNPIVITHGGIIQAMGSVLFRKDAHEIDCPRGCGFMVSSGCWCDNNRGPRFIDRWEEIFNE